MRLDGAQGKKQVWRPHVDVRNLSLSRSNILYWRMDKILLTFSGVPIVIGHPGICAPIATLIMPLEKPQWF